MPEDEHTSGPNKEELKAAIGRIVDSKLFDKSPRLGKLFRFLADQSIEGARVSSHEIAKVLDLRDQNLAADVGRLRAKLQEYYAASGRFEPIVITIPKGSYQPIFETRSPVSVEFPHAVLPSPADLPFSQRLTIFIAYATEDRESVRRLRDHLQRLFHAVWMEPPAEEWTAIRRRTIDESDVVIICVSKNRSAASREKQQARASVNQILEARSEKRVRSIVVARLDREARVPTDLSGVTSFDVWAESGFKSLVDYLSAQHPAERSLPAPSEMSADFEVQFDPSFSPDEVREMLSALAAYYRACGGAGFELDMELQETVALEPIHV